MRLRLFALLASTMMAGGALAAQPVATGPAPAVAGKPTFGTFGFDEAGMNRAVRPGDDFYRYASGDWEKTTEIPADRSSYGMFHRLQDLSLERTRAILDEARAKPSSKIGAFYASFMDEAAAQKKGATPLSPWLAAIRGAKDKAALAAEMARLQQLGVRTPFRMGIAPDDKDPSQYIAQFAQSGLGLPDRDYYLKPDTKLAETRTAYQAFLAKMLTLTGEPDAEARAAAVMTFETSLAGVQWTRIESRDVDKTYNKWSRADFDAKAPGFAWKPYLAGLGIDGQQTFLVAQPSAMAGEAKIFADAPLAVLKDYLTLRTIGSYAKYLSTPFVDTNFAFNGTVLSGTPQNQPRWKRGVTLVSNEMGEAIGQVYVQRYFPPEAKAAADALVRNIITAFGRRLQTLSWMAPETKRKAMLKLAAFKPMIGYPDKWRDYSALEIAPDDLVGNVARAEGFEYRRGLGKLGQPVDRGEWQMTPMEINAYANFGLNEIVFPAAILQPPFFDPHADPAVNYGGIGAVIGHEISHHFDDQGAKYDMHGRLSDWWTQDDVKKFGELTDRIVKQYDSYEPLPGLHIQGALTQGENIADLAGLTVAYEAYQISLKGKTAPVIAGYSGDQRFYLGWAQVWRRSYRDANLRQRLLTDPHSPSIQRSWVVRNLDPFYPAYSLKPGEAMYLTPAERIRIW